MKTIKLPEWVRDHAALHAQSVVEYELGITDASSPEYEREYEKAFHKFCREYYEHSLIPAETQDSIKSSNPYVTPGKESYFKNIFDAGKIPPNEREKAWRNLKAAAQTIERIFFDSKYGEYTFSHYEAKDREKYLDVMANRYLRLLLLSVVLELVSHIYSADGAALKGAIKEALSNVRPADLNNRKKTIDKFMLGITAALDKFSTQRDVALEKLAPFMIEAVKGMKTQLTSKQTEGMPAQLAEGLKKAKTEKPTKVKPSDAEMKELMTDFAEKYVASQGGRQVSAQEIMKAFELGMDDFIKKRKK
jgi:hypothetical protein